MEKYNLPYIKRRTAEFFNFYQIPKILIKDRNFSELDGWSILLFGMLLDRVALSADNAKDFTNENGDVFIIFTVEEAMEKCGKGKQAVIKYFKQLEDVGLIERKRRGLGKPSIIFVKDFTYVENSSNFKKCENHTSANTDFKKYENHTSGSMKTEPLEVLKSYPNNTDYNKTDLNDTDSINQSSRGARKTDVNDTIEDYSIYRDLIQDNIEYDYFMTEPSWSFEKKRVGEIIEIMLDCICSSADKIRIGKQDIPKEIVKSRMLKINSGHIEYIIGCLKSNTTKVKNIKEYLKTVIYNASLTIDNYYSTEVNHDLYGDD